ncbi:MAG: phosphoesterase [Planctomycetes bacterium]|nr:phosphoesterase [Planctomycetota bacterium]
MPKDERVLVIPTERFRAAGCFHGFRAADAAYRAAVLEPSAFQFRPRSEVETQPEFKQLIPYVVLKCGNDLFHYRRGAAGTEARLRSLRSVGIGGHISEEDARGGDDPYATGMMRELTEEVQIGCDWKDSFFGFINDDRTPVGSVHLGVVHLVELASQDVRSREEALAEAGFSPLAELAARNDEFETWSQFVLAELGRG